MGKTVESFRIALEGEISGGVALLELCASLIGKPLTSLRICAVIMLWRL